MATEESVIENFSFLGIQVEGEVLAKCVELCREYSVDPEAFVEQWMAFSLSHLNAAPPTVEKLNLLEKKEFAKEHDTSLSLQVDKPRRGNNNQLPLNKANQVQHENEVISEYLPTTPKRGKLENQVVPNESIAEISPATCSPSTAHSAKYASRANSGTVLMNHGKEELVASISQPNEVSTTLNINVTQTANEDGETLASKAMFGFELLHEKASLCDVHIQFLSKCILQKLGVTHTSSVRCKSQTSIFVAGRIECDADAKLNPQSIVLQGTWEESLSQSVPLDVTHLKSYSLFPGQVVVVKGSNPRGDRLLAEEIFADAALPVQPRSLDLQNSFQGKMSLLIAAGPFTPTDSLQYEPLKDLIAVMGKTRPHVVILTGPFLDEEHPMVKENTLSETYKAFYENILDSIDEMAVNSPHTKILVQSSSKDAFHPNIFPTPAYTSKRQHPSVTFLPDPAFVNINGVHVFLTSTDVLMHISQQEISLGSQSDKLSRLAGHVLSQRCALPCAASRLPVDTAFWSSHAQLNVAPHIAVMPSLFRYNIKETNGCIVLNPERLTKGTGGGTYARLTIDFQDGRMTDVNSSFAAQIVRI